MSTPTKFKLKEEWWPLVMVTMTIAISYFSYSQLPSRVASHWNISGVVDGYSSREFHVFFFPLILAGLYLLLLFLPQLDPKKERYIDFASTYNIFKNIIISIMFIIFLATTIYNLGYAINVGVIISSAIGTLFLVMGNYFGKLKQNWFVGIKNPWTLSSENVWNKTHRFGGKLFMLWGIAIIITPWLPPALGIGVFITGAVLATIGSFAYSYFIYKQEKQKPSSTL